MSTQAVRFDRRKWTQPESVRWLGSHGYRPIRLDVTPNQLRYRIREPGQFRRMVAYVPKKKDGSVSTRGVSFVLGYR